MVKLRADQAEGSEGDISRRPDPSLTSAEATFVKRQEVVVLDERAISKCVSCGQWQAAQWKWSWA